MKTNTKHIIKSIIELSLLSFTLITVTFGWFIKTNDKEYQNLIFGYYEDPNNAGTFKPYQFGIQDNILEASITTLEGDPITESFEFTGFAPNQIFAFKLMIGNKSTNIQNISIMMSGIVPFDANDETHTTMQLTDSTGETATGNLLERLYFSIAPDATYGAGLTGMSIPSSKYYHMCEEVRVDTSDSAKLSYIFNVYTGINVCPKRPSTISEDDDDVVNTFNCFFYFDAEAGNEYIRKGIKIGAFTIILL